MPGRDTILLAADDPLVAVRKKTLEEYGYTVIAAGSPKEIIEIIWKTEKIDLALMDRDLCDRDSAGADVVVKEKDIPVLFLYDDSGPEIPDNTEGINVYGYVARDSRSTILDASIRAALRLHRTKRTMEEHHGGTLRENEEGYRAIVEKIDEGIFVHDGAHYKYMNERVCDICGYAKEELYGMHLLDFIYPDDRDYVANIIRKRAAGERVPSPYRVRIIRKDGDMRHVEVAVAGMMYKNEFAFLVAVRDISGYVMVEMALQESEDRFRRLAENAREMIFRASLFDYRYEYVSPSSYDIVGYAPEDFYTGTINAEKMVHPDFAEYFREQKRRLLKGEVPELYEYKIIHRNGRERWLHAKCVLIPDENGQPAALEGIITDITDLKNLEEDLRMHRDHLGELVEERTRELRQEIKKRKEKEEQYLSLIESVKEWIWETDAGFSITYVSPRLTDILGYAPEEVIGRSPFDLMPEREGKRLQRLTRKVRNLISVEATAFHKQGQPYFIEINGRPFFDETGAALGFRGSCNDITERKILIDSLKKREQELASKSESLQEVNAALKVLFKQKEQDMRAFEENMVSNLRKMVLPYIGKMQKTVLDSKHKSYVDIIENNLNQIISPFLNRLASFNFTPREMEVVLLIKEGRTTKAMAEIMGVAPSAIDSHRNNIRKKFGLNKRKINLRTYIMSLT